MVNKPRVAIHTYLCLALIIYKNKRKNTSPYSFTNPHQFLACFWKKLRKNFSESRFVGDMVMTEEQQPQR